MDNQALIARGKSWPRFGARAEDPLSGLGKKVRHGERAIQAFLFLCGALTIFTTIAIVLVLGRESLLLVTSEYVTESGTVHTISVLDFVSSAEWQPHRFKVGIAPLVSATLMSSLIAMLVALPLGLGAAIYLSEYASTKVRSTIKPVLEVLAGVPTVVYGFFAALTVGPAFRGFFNGLGERLLGGPLHDLGLYLMTVQNQMALVAGVVMGIMLIPFVSSLSDDILNAVPQSLRDGSLAMGATRSETVTRVVLPAALPGVAAAFLLAVSRAIGETMIVTMAAGLQARATLNPLESVTTVTVQIVTLLTGDQAFDSPKTLSAFGLGLTLFVVTLALNLVALRIVRHYREQYD